MEASSPGDPGYDSSKSALGGGFGTRFFPLLIESALTLYEDAIHPDLADVPRIGVRGVLRTHRYVRPTWQLFRKLIYWKGVGAVFYVQVALERIPEDRVLLKECATVVWSLRR